MFHVEMLPAAHGDTIWISYGSPAAPRRILIDGGLRYTYNYLRERILALPPGHRRFELLVVTHVDGDHIEGVVRLLQDQALGLEIGDIWFNGQPQLDKLPDPAADGLGPEQGEFLGALIRRREQEGEKPLWNTHFGGDAVVVQKDGPLPTWHRHGLTLTVIAPGLRQLLTLKDNWAQVLADAGFQSGDVDGALAALAKRKDLQAPDELGGEPEEEDESEFDEASTGDDFADVLGEDEREFGSDDTAANGSSIALLAEYEGRRALLAGDAYAQVMVSGLRRWLEEESARRGRSVGTVDLDCYKVAHHGSVGNVTEEFLDLLRCRRYLFSSSGKQFGHPRERTVGLILDKHRHRAKARLFFNYRTGQNEVWADPQRQKDRNYEAFYPSGLTVGLE